MNRLFARTLVLLLALLAGREIIAQEESLNYEKALEAYNAGQDSEALVYLKKALRENPNLSHNVYTARELLVKLKENGAGDNPYVLVLEGQLLRSQGQSAAALDLVERHNFGEKEPLSYGLLRGILQLELEKIPEAQASAQRLLAVFPDNVEVYNFAADTSLAVGKLDDAETYIARSLKLAPDNVDANFNQAMLYTERNNLEVAQKFIDGIIGQHPNHSKSLLLKARILFLQGKYKQAIEWSNKVPAYDGSAIGAEELQIEIYSKVADWKSAKLIAQKMVRDDPRNTEYLLRLASIAMKQEDKELAANTLHRLYPIWKKDPEKLRQLAALHVSAGNTVEARKCLETARALDKQSYGVQLDLARLDFTEGKLDKAESAVAKLQKKFGSRSESASLLVEIALARSSQLQQP